MKLSYSTPIKNNFSQIIGFVQCLRPKQWSKNLLVLAATIFSINQIYDIQIINAFFGFLLFCMVSGCVYVLNDYVDREKDKMHPEKQFRPMASGALNPFFGILLSFLLLFTSLICSYLISLQFTVILMLYFLLNVAYSFKFKHVVILDVMLIAAGFVLRAISGAVIINLPFTPWFIICTLLLALFLAISKRRHELILLQNNKGEHRKVLNYYSPALLDQMNSIVTTSTIMSYSLYTFTSGRTIQLMWTIPFVIYGIFRYLYLIHIEEKGGRPEKILLQDKHILITVILYAITVITILHFFK